MAAPAEKKPREFGLHKLRTSKGEKALEIGFGTGRDLLALARSVGSSGRVYGIDLSQGMLDVARERLE